MIAFQFVNGRGKWKFDATEGLAWRVRAGLAVAMLGGLIILWQSSIAIGIVGVVFVLIGTPLAWPREEFGGSWYGVVIAGGLLCVLSPLVAIGAQTLGGWMGAIGCLLIVCGGVAGLPALRLSDSKSTTV